MNASLRKTRRSYHEPGHTHFLIQQPCRSNSAFSPSPGTPGGKGGGNPCLLAPTGGDGM
jgi:hypothetical protein